jgi:hypothetical protein
MLPVFHVADNWESMSNDLEYAHKTLTVGHLLADQHSRVTIDLLQYEEIDAGETMALHCVRRALWLARHGRLPFALVVGQTVQYGMVG